MDKTETLYDPMRPFSESRLWEMQKAYYDEHGVEPFSSQKIPSYITNSPQTARNYAEMIYAFLRDLGRQGRDQETVYLVELGAGSGQLCFHILQYYSRYLAVGPDPVPPLCYILTDISQATLDFWQTHPRLQKYFRSGMLDVAKFDADKDESIYLTYQGKRLEPGNCQQPLIVVGNYFFDTIPQELLYFESGQTYQVTMGLVDPNPEGDEKDLLERTEVRFGYDLFDANSIDPLLKPLIELYQKVLSQSHVLIPSLGVQCIERLKKLSERGLLLLVGDKGIHQLRDLDGMETPQLVTHGVKSTYTNFHALGAYCNQSDGRTFLPNRQKFNLIVAGFLLVDNPVLFPSFGLAYDKWAAKVGPDENYLVKLVMEKGFSNLALDEVIAVLRYFLNDAKIFQALYSSIEDHIPNIIPKGKEVLAVELVEVWENYYQLDPEDKIEEAIRGLLNTLDQPGTLMTTFP